MAQESIGMLRADHQVSDPLDKRLSEPEVPLHLIFPQSRDVSHIILDKAGSIQIEEVDLVEAVHEPHLRHGRASLMMDDGGGNEFDIGGRETFDDALARIGNDAAGVDAHDWLHAGQIIDHTLHGPVQRPALGKLDEAVAKLPVIAATIVDRIAISFATHDHTEFSGNLRA